MGHSEADCRQVVEQLFLYLDGEIAGDECGSIELHLRRCAPCLDHVAFERDLKEIIRRKCTEGAAPPDLTQRLIARITNAIEGKPPQQGPFG